MKCPKCKYISFDHNENCPKCRKDLTEVRERMNFPAYCPLLATQADIDSQIPDGSIRIEQKDDTIVEESMDMQFSDSQDFESAFDSSLDEALGESDLDFTLTEEADDLSLDFDEFSIDDTGSGHSEQEMKTIAEESLEDELNLTFADDTGEMTANFEDIAGEDGADSANSEQEMETILADSLENELDLSFADDTGEMTSDFEDISAEDSGGATLDFEDLAMDDADPDKSEQEMETILADSLEGEPDLSFADDTDEMTASFEDIAADDSGTSTLDFEDLSENDADSAKPEQEMETILADSLEGEPDLSFADDTDEMTASFEEIAADDPGDSTLDFEDLAMEEPDTEIRENDSIELAEKEVDKITLDFEDSISAEEKRKDEASAELEVLDLDLDLSSDNSS